MLPSLTLSDVLTIPVNEPAAALLAPIVVPSIEPPSILAVVTVPRICYCCAIKGRVFAKNYLFAVICCFELNV